MRNSAEDAGSEQPAALRRVAAGCGCASAALGTVTLLAWTSGRLLLASVRPDYIPMAPSSALAFIALGMGLVALGWKAARRFARAYAAAAGAAVLCLSAILLAQFLLRAFLGAPLDVEGVLVQSSTKLGAVATGRMSFPAAVNFLLGGAALLAIALGRGKRMAGGCASAVTALGAVVTLGYLYGTPLLYGGSVIPMALTTACSFDALGVGLIALSAPGRFPLRCLIGESVRARLLRLFLPLTAGSVVGYGAIERLLAAIGEPYALLISALTVATATGAVALVAVRRVSALIEGSEQELRRVADERDGFFTLSLDMLGIAGFDGRFKRLNPAWGKTLGWELEELLGRPYLEFVHPEDRAATSSEAGKLADGIATVSFENRYRCKDGSYRWLEWTAAPAQREGLIYAVAHDRTAHKKAEDEVRKTQLFLDSIVENIPNMIFVKDAKELKFVRFNRAGEELLGYARGELLGKNDYDFFPKEQAASFIEKDRQVLQGRVLVDIPEEPLQTKDRGTRTLHTKKLPLLDERGEPQYLLGISEDITERKRLDTAKSEFIALASHQLRTPLTAIRWTLELLRDDGGSFSDRQRRLVGDAYDATVRLADSLQTMLRVSRIDARTVELNLSAVRLGDVLRRIQSNYAEAAVRKRLAVSLSCPEALSLRTDAHLLAEILSNLVGNAIAYTPAGGSIRVDARSAEDGMHISVADTGIGIPPDAQARVFTKLFRAKNAMVTEVGGSGLGLYIASSLATLLGGRLSFVSQERQGTTFTLHLPPSPPPAHA